jgi:hypothetical protein
MTRIGLNAIEAAVSSTLPMFGMSAANQREEDLVDDLDQGRVGNRLLGHDHVMADEVYR